MIDFSCKHEVWIRNPDGTLSRMDEPYFRAQKIASGTWRILSDGDYSYLIEGDNEAIAIDSGYGAGNIRQFMQTLTDKPVRKIANTHHHFDHTANNSYFELAYMSAEAIPLATIPSPSFAGIHFPRNYPIGVLSDGDILPLKGRNLQVFTIPDHAVSSMVFLDRREQILFSGNEFMPMGKCLNGGLKSWLQNLEKLHMYRDNFKILCGGAFEMDASFFDACLKCAQHAMQQTETELLCKKHKEFPEKLPEQNSQETRIIYERMKPRPEDRGSSLSIAAENIAYAEYAGTNIRFDITKKFL